MYHDEELNTKFEALSDRQKAILIYIEDFRDEVGFPPTIREIGEACDIGSTSVVNYNLNKLVDGEWLERTKEKSRGIRLLHPRKTQPSRERPVRAYESESMIKVPRMGRIVASAPVASFADSSQDPDIDTIDISRDMLHGLNPGEVFALEVEGDSMIDALIGNGDIVILHKTPICNDGDMVAVWLPEREETTLKEFHDEGDRIRLQPKNPTMDPIYVHPNNCQIQGKVLSVLRML